MNFVMINFIYRTPSKTYQYILSWGYITWDWFTPRMSIFLPSSFYFHPIYALASCPCNAPNIISIFSIWWPVNSTICLWCVFVRCMEVFFFFAGCAQAPVTSSILCVLEQRGNERQIWGLARWMQSAWVYLKGEKKKSPVLFVCLCVCVYVRDRKCVCRWVLYLSDTPEPIVNRMAGHCTTLVCVWVCVCVCVCVCVWWTPERELHSSKLLSASILPAPVFIRWDGEARLRRLQHPIQAHIAGLPRSTHSHALQYSPLYHAIPLLDVMLMWNI